jgi:hypothetical protein
VGAELKANNGSRAKRGTLHLSVQTEELCLQEIMGEVGSESEEMPPLVDCSDEEIAYPIKGEALVIRCALNMQIKEDDVDQQWKNIFHTRCHIQNKEFNDVFSKDIHNGLPP